MNTIKALSDFFTTQGAQLSVSAFILNLFLAATLAFALSRIYVKYGKSLSNRQIFAKNFILITVTTMFIITVVKSSLALSLGLVGALSIVRFRTAIKEPEELAYLFLSISIGLGLGADQRLITLIAFAIISGVIVLKNQIDLKLNPAGDEQNLYLAITSQSPQKIALEQIVEILEKHCSEVELKRFDETKEILEASFLAKFDNFAKLEQAKHELQKLSGSVKISFFDNKTIS